MSSNTNQKNDKVWVEVEPIKFEDQAQTQFVTSLDLAAKFSHFFKSCLVDYEGCFLRPFGLNKENVLKLQNNDSMVELTVYLRKKNNGDTANGKIVSLLDVTRNAEPNATIAQRINTFNSMTKQKIYDLTPDTIKFFESFGYGGRWNPNMAVEEVDPTNHNIIYMKISGLDPVKIIRKMYGDKVDGESFEYRLTNSKYLNPNNFMLKIDRLNEENMKELASKIGFMQPQGGIMMVRG